MTDLKMEHLSPYQLQSTAPLPPPPSGVTTTKPKSKPRKRVNTAEKRHQHNAVERQRRETLNSKFIVLARLLPALAKTGRPSKSAIVNGSISHLTKQREQRLLASKLLRSLCAERDMLAKECNEWRAASGYAGNKSVGAVSGWTDEMDEVCAVEDETFGEFAGMGMGEEGDEEEGDESMDAGGNNNNVGMGSMSMGMGIEAATAAVASFDNHRLITPRSSTEIDPLSLALGLSIPLSGSHSNAQRPAHASRSMSTQALEMNWPGGYPFTPALSSEPLSISLNSNSLATGSSSSSLPFNAFMTDSLESLSDSSPSSLLGIPTPPTTSDFSRFTHTPSPRSSESFEESKTNNHGGFNNHFAAQQQQSNNTPSTTWTQQQQLLFLHSVQQQQLQNNQLAEIHHRSMSAATPSSVSPSGGAGGQFGRSQSADSGSSFNPLHHSAPIYSTITFQQMQQQQQQQVQVLLQHQQQQKQQVQQQQAQQQQGMPRMSNEQLEAWRKIATGNATGSGGLNIWAQNALKGY